MTGADEWRACPQLTDGGAPCGQRAGHLPPCIPSTRGPAAELVIIDEASALLAQPFGPAADPLLTVRMEPPDTQARRLDLTVPRAVRTSFSDTPWTIVTDRVYTEHVSHEHVADWPIAPWLTIGAAQRLTPLAPGPPMQTIRPDPDQAAAYHAHRGAHLAADRDVGGLVSPVRTACGIDVSSFAVTRYRDRTSCPGCLAGSEPDTIADERAAARPDGCPDGGVCHHWCGADGPCFRVLSCGPLSAARYPDDRWPDDVIAAERAREARP